MKCSNCKKEILDTATFCKFCGFKVDDKNLKDMPIKNQYNKFMIIGTIVVLAIIYLLGIKCRAGICILPSGFKGEYCVLHTCNKSDCYNKVAKEKEYCYTHLPSTATNSHYELEKTEKAEDVLCFSDISVLHESTHTICKATITNNGEKTYSGVEVKGEFKDSSDTVYRTKRNFAVGSEGLAPGESTTFELSVSKDFNIIKCDLEIVDYKNE